MNFENDKRIVLTLDAGGTNFVFDAVQGNKEIVESVTLPSNGNNLDKCLKNINDGFSLVKDKLEAPPAAISFAFPGPAEYPLGIIGDLGNLPAFRGGIALGPMLEEKFNLPVFINNDGDLFAYGEAIAGFLPYINKLLHKAGSPKRYNNLFGITLGTGFGAGIVRNNELYIGDNSCGGEIWLLRNKLNPDTNAEEGASIRAVQNVYSELSGIPFIEAPSPKDIYEIASGKKQGNREAALEGFRRLGESVGDSLSNSITLLDGIIVIGGGIAGAYDLFMPALISEMNGTYENPAGERFPRLALKTYNLEDEMQLKRFLIGNKTEISVPFSEKKITYDPRKRIGVGISKLGTSKAVAIGAYAFALQQLDKYKIDYPDETIL
jgi:glucokinase